MEPVKHPLPWVQRVVNGAIFNAHGTPVSFVEEPDYILHVANKYAGLMAALHQIEQLALAPRAATKKAIAAAARLAIAEAERIQQAKPREDLPSPEKVRG